MHRANKGYGHAKWSRVCLAGMALLVSTASLPGEVALYVSPRGQAGWTGALSEPSADQSDGPLPSIQAARDVIRKHRAKGEWKEEAITIYLRGGMYYLPETLVFEPQDSGSEGRPITYAAYQDETPIVSGGRVITGWRDAEVNGQPCWAVDIPEVKEGKWYFWQLFVNGRRCPRPQVPEKGWYNFASIPPHSEKYLKREGVRDHKNQNDRACYRPGDVKRWHNLGDVEFVYLMSWDEAHLFVENLDENTHTLEFTQPSYLGADVTIKDDKSGRYYMVNVREALNQPGQWYLDRVTGTLYYLPMPGETTDNTTVIAPRLGELMCVLGEEPRNPLEERCTTFWSGPRLIAKGPVPVPVRHLRFKKLAFQHNNWFLPPDRSAGGQAMARLAAALFLQNAIDCRIVDCNVSGISNYAIELGAECKDCVVSGCTLTDLGAGGVKLCEDSHHNTVTDCEVFNGGLIFPGAVGVWVGHSWANTVSHNHIHHLYYTGISVGWVWGNTRPSKAACNIIEYNHIHDIGQKLLSDMGGIYTLGSSPGTILRYNLIHDVEAFTYGGNGLYNDEGSSFVLLENNIAYRCNDSAYHLNYGKGNILRNNIFAFAGMAEVTNSDRKGQPPVIIVERNIIYSDQETGAFGDLPRMHGFADMWKGMNYTFDYNLYYMSGGRKFDWPGDRTLEQWQEWTGQDKHSIIADPLFVDPENGDFSLKSGSPAEKIGFVPIDTSKIGRLKKQ